MTRTSASYALALAAALCMAGPADARERTGALAGCRITSHSEVAGGELLAGTRRVDDDRVELVLLRAEGPEIRSIEPPFDQVLAMRDDPRPMVAGGELVGLAWLEGDSPLDYGVRVAEWLGGTWSEPQWLSPPQTGSQLALTAARLADGRMLIAWARFVAGDDDIYWTVGERGDWRRPSRAHAGNEVPDILPSMIAVGDGALLAWTRYDGRDYRVRLARWTGDGWRETDLLGPPSSVFPELHVVGGRRYLLYRTAVPPTWSLAELDGTGVVRRLAVLPSGSPDPPRLIRSDDEVGLAWGDTAPQPLVWDRP